MRLRPRRPGLRGRAALAFTAGGGVVAVLVAVAAYGLAREYLVHQRERIGLQEAWVHASYVRQALLVEDRPLDLALGDLRLDADTSVVVRTDGRTKVSSLEDVVAQLPVSVVEAVEGGRAAYAWTSTPGGPGLVVGTPLPAVDATFYQLSRTAELDETLRTLRSILGATTLMALLLAAALGRWVAGRVLQPLDDTAAAAAQIAGGALATRLPETDDPDLATLVGSFNSMVDAVAQRIEREERLTADVAHELRTPLTALVASVGLLEGRRADLSERGQQALDLVRAELDRFERLLEDLLTLARLDADLGDRPTDEVAVSDLVRATLLRSGRSPDLLDDAATMGVRIRCVKRELEQALVNLFDNADRHGGGLTGVGVLPDGPDHVLVLVDDAGPGIDPVDRDHVFERFARGSPATRRPTPGTGLGLSIVARAVDRHGGSAWCTDRPGGGARLVLRLPASGPSPDVSLDVDTASTVPAQGAR